MIEEALENRTTDGAISVDAVLYSNNSIFGLVSKASSAEGEMTVNGALLASDVGLLVPGNGGIGLQLNYDQRVAQMIELADEDSMIVIRESLYLVTPVASGSSYLDGKKYQGTGTGSEIY